MHPEAPRPDYGQLLLPPAAATIAAVKTSLTASPHQAPVQAVRSVDPINAWAADVTRGMITQAVPPNTPFNMIATNAGVCAVSGVSERLLASGLGCA